METAVKQYLGDSVYVEVERGMLKLTTDNGLGPTNTIYLEPEIYMNLARYVAELAEQEKQDGTEAQ